MLRNLINKLTSKPQPEKRWYDDLAWNDQETPIYPPINDGIPASPLDVILRTQTPILRRLFDQLPFSHEEYERLVVPVVENYSRYVHLLPGSESDHHSKPGGLLHHGLDAGERAVRLMMGKDFCGNETPSMRNMKAPRWRFAAFCGGLLHDIGKPATDVQVYTDPESGGAVWRPEQSFLLDFLEAGNYDRYYLKWNKNRKGAHEVWWHANISKVITEEARGYLLDPDGEIYREFMEAVAGKSASKKLTNIVLEADHWSAREDKLAYKHDPSETTGVPLQRFILDALQKLVEVEPVNEPGALIWHANDSVFINWRSITPKIIEELGKKGVPTGPADPERLAAVMSDWGYSTPYEESDDGVVHYWKFFPEMLEGVALLCLKIEDPTLIFQDVIPKSVPGHAGGPDLTAACLNSTKPRPADIKDSHYSSDRQQSATEEASSGDIDSQNEYFAEGYEEINQPENEAVTQESAGAETDLTEQAEAPGDTYQMSDGIKAMAALVGKETEIASKTEPSPDSKEPPGRDKRPVQTCTNFDPLITKALERRRKNPEILSRLPDGDYGIPHPNFTKLLGDPKEVMNLLSERKLLRPGGSLTSRVNGLKYLVLSSALSKQLHEHLTGDVSREKDDRKTRKEKFEKNKAAKQERDHKNELVASEIEKQLIEQLENGSGPYITGDIEKIVRDEKTFLRFSFNECQSAISEALSIRPGVAKGYLRSLEEIYPTKDRHKNYLEYEVKS